MHFSSMMKKAIRRNINNFEFKSRAYMLQNKALLFAYKLLNEKSFKEKSEKL